ncbi:MAG: amino acid adenylation domain-containing protein [Chloroflexi bacterium]|nr:amino acid adenylation domain-containing protein [Chloroflexota bacterium]
MWFLHQMEPDSPEYNIPDVVRLRGHLDLPALETSVNAIIRRHETLRTAFLTVDGRPQLQIADDLTLAIPLIDLRHLPPAEREAEALRRAEAEAVRPFDLTRPPLLRLTLLQMDEAEYLALLTMHHIVADGWSMGVFIQELAAGYTAVTQNQPLTLPELPIQYSDFAWWQRHWLQGDALEEQLAYWREKLAGTPPLLELPTDHPRPAVQTHHGAHLPFTLPASLTRQLKEISRQADATLFMTLLAAFQTLLSRYAGQEDVNVGTPIANRNRAEIEGLIGFFVNTLVLRADLSGNPAFTELLRQVRETTLEAYAHQDVPFDKVVDALQPERNMSHSPLFQVMFTWQNAPQTAVSLPDLRLESLPVENHVANFDLTLVLEETPDGLAGGFEYNADLFAAETIKRMMTHFQTLLAGIAENPQTGVADLPLLPEEEWRQMQAWNDTAVPLPNQPIHHLIAQKAAETPDAVAVCQGAAQYTYRELDARANQLAHYLQQQGVGPDKLVGVALSRSPEMITALLGILKAGGAYLPLDPDYPPERLAFMIQDAQPVLILTDDSQVVESSDSRVVLLSGSQIVELPNHHTSQLSDYQTTRLPDYSTNLDSLAYVIYTSGSTGQPKGVMIPHRGVLNHNLAAQKLFELQSSDRVWQFATINFDTAVEEIFPTLITGATLVLRQQELPAVTELCQIIRQERLTVLDLPTAYWHEWVHELARSGTALPGCLRLVIVGGDKANAAELRLWQEITADTAVIWLNTYGPTETTIIATAYRPNGDAGDNVPIGKPLPNTQTWILDKQGRPAPIGVPGELHIAGHNLARGYLNRPELTAEKFVPLPVIGNRLSVNGNQSPTTDHRLPNTVYRTGDLARYRPDGNIEFLGRVDHQVKIRGFRVELPEIEMTLALHSAIRETAVTVQENTPGSKRLIAYYTQAEDTAVTVAALRQFLAEKLPAYMIPAFFVPLDAMPLTPSGKIDRRALPEPEQSRPDLAAAYVPPQSEKEAILAEIWQAVLGLEQVGVHDNFFELGGDSILTIQVISRANQAGLRLSPRHFFAGPTIAELAAAAAAAPAIQAEQGPVTGPVPLTPIQHWFFAQEIPARHHWNQSLLLRVKQPLQREWLETAVTHLTVHHDALRLRFTQTDEGWTQTNATPEETTAVHWFDLSHLPPVEQGAAVTRHATALQTGLDLADGPLMCVAYFDLGAEQDGRLFIAIHHLAIDGVSWRILLEDLQLAYTQLAQGTAVHLPPKTTAYKTWAERLRDYAQSPAAREELAYWRGLAQAAVRPLPRDFADGRNREADTETVAVSLTPAETEALLRDVPPVYRTKINDALLTALAHALQSWTGSSAALIDLESHGRADLFADVDVSRTVGWFTAVYPVHLASRPDPGEAVKTIKEQLRRVPHLGIGYYLLRYVSEDEAIRRQMAALPQAEISFNYLGQFGQDLPPDTPFAPAPESAGPDRSPDSPRQYLIEIDGSIAAGQLQLTWSYSGQIHTRQTITRLANSFLAALRALINYCQTPTAGGLTPSDVPLANLDQKKLDKLMAKLSKK